MTGWWVTTTSRLLDDGLIDIGDGYRAKNAEFVENGGLPFVRVGDIGTRIRLNGLDELPDTEAAKYGSKVSQPLDSLITMKGTVGRVAFVTAADRPFVYSPQISYWRSRDPRRLDPRWLRYWLESPEFLSQASATKGATDMADYINLRDQRRMRITLPPTDVQDQVAAVLGALDGLIATNVRRIAVLEEIVRTIYREWFVYFRYPGHEEVALVGSALGPIPERWRVGSVDDLVALSKATLDPSTVEPSTPAVGLEHIPRRQITLDDWGEAGALGSRKATFVAGDLLFGKIRPYFHKVSVAPVDGICSTDAIVLRPYDEHWGQAVLSIASDEFVAHAVQTSNGTKMPRADWKVIRQFLVGIPPIEIARKFSDTARVLLQHAQSLMFQTRDLASLRDLLLPKLVTGKIDVSGLDLDALTQAATA